MWVGEQHIEMMRKVRSLPPRDVVLGPWKVKVELVDVKIILPPEGKFVHDRAKSSACRPNGMEW
jgi:hypothetical protein